MLSLFLANLNRCNNKYQENKNSNVSSNGFKATSSGKIINLKFVSKVKAKNKPCAKKPFVEKQFLLKFIANQLEIKEDLVNSRLSSF